MYMGPFGLAAWLIGVVFIDRLVAEPAEPLHFLFRVRHSQWRRKSLTFVVFIDRFVL
jgi:hypothetical protein